MRKKHGDRKYLGSKLFTDAKELKKCYYLNVCTVLAKTVFFWWLSGNSCFFGSLFIVFRCFRNMVFDNYEKTCIKQFQNP